MAETGVSDDGYSNQARQDPERDFRKLSPQGEILAVVYIERGQHEDIRRSHTAEMQGEVATLREVATAVCARERQRAKNEEMVVCRPAQERQTGHRDKDAKQGPKVEPAERRVAARAFRAQHRDCAMNYCRDPEQNVYGDNREKYRLSRRDRDAKEIRHFGASANVRYWPIADKLSDILAFRQLSTHS